MISQITKLLFIMSTITYITLSGCGKVVQQSTSSDKKEPTFSLSFKVENITLTTKTEEPTTKNTPLLIKEPLSLKNNFNDKSPIILSLKGYKKNKVHDLAWGKSSISSEIIKQKQTTKNITTSSPEKPKKETIIYKGKIYDKQKIKVISAKESQFEGKFNASKKEWEFKTNKVKKSYDYYLAIAYGSNTVYQIKTIDQTIVSNNKTINLNTEPLDTFRSIIFINAFRTLEFDHNYYQTINSLFDDTFFKSLQYVFPKINQKEFAKKSPIIKVSDPIIDQCIKILDLSLIDIKETEAYVKSLNKKYFTESQKEILLKNIQSLSKNIN